MTSSVARVPVIDVSPLVRGAKDLASVGRELRAACEDHGFFYVVGHGVDAALQSRLESASREFFARPLHEKMRISMEKGGRAWRGYFPVGDELTSGKPDLKEGIYFGEELGADHPAVRAGTPLCGANLFPSDMPELRSLVLTYLGEMTRLGHDLMKGLSVSLGLAPDYFHVHYTSRPFLLFRIFCYPPPATKQAAEGWGVGEHTDYGILTILKQDDCGGLEVKARRGWIAAPPVQGSFVCNIGDMLDRMTLGRYRSTPHRVRNTAGRPRLSFPFFFDPGFEAPVKPLPLDGLPPATDTTSRWDGLDVHAFEGTYGDYLLGKVAKVFPGLGSSVLRGK